MIYRQNSSTFLCRHLSSRGIPDPVPPTRMREMRLIPSINCLLQQNSHSPRGSLLIVLSNRSAGRLRDIQTSASAACASLGMRAPADTRIRSCAVPVPICLLAHRSNRSEESGSEWPIWQIIVAGVKEGASTLETVSTRNDKFLTRVESAARTLSQE